MRGYSRCYAEPQGSPIRAYAFKAMAVLGLCGPAAKDAVPELAVALKSTDQETAQQAALALANIDPSHDGLLPVLTQMLDPSSYNPAPRQNAVKAFDQMGKLTRGPQFLH